MSVLVLVEHDNKNMSPVMRSVLQAALQLDETPTLLVVGYNCDSVVLEVSQLAHVDSVWHVDNASYEYHFPEQLSKLIAKIAKPFSHVIAPATTFGKNILPRCAALLDVTQVTDVTKIIDKNTFEHPIYAGNAIEVVEILDSQKVLTIRGTAFEPIIDSQNPCSVEKISDVFINNKTRFISKKGTDLVRPDLNSASIVVSGGRGLQSIEKFKLVDELADALGAAVGASRAAVDAGFAPNDCQVGQTGKIVAPSLYIALGISGAVQHLAGMKDSKVIVAINSDEDAPIFQIASYGLVGDLFSLVPEIINELKTRGIAKC